MLLTGPAGLSERRMEINNLMEVHIMARKVTDVCVNCGACESVCPVGAIAEGDGQHVIDPDVCIDCGACEGECPVGAIEEA